MQGLDNYVSEILVGFFTALTTWVFTRKKQELEMTEKAIEIWRTLSQDLDQKVKDLIDDQEKTGKVITQLKEEVSQLKTENLNLKQSLKQVQRENEKLKTRLSRYETTHTDPPKKDDE